MMFLARLIIAFSKMRPYSHIYKNDRLYMGRWWVYNPYDSPKYNPDRASARIHHIASPDLDRAPHNHPWDSFSIILSGGYREDVYSSDGQHLYYRHHKPGNVVLISKDRFHKITSVEPNTFTLFVTTHKTQTWGYGTRRGFIPHYNYRDGGDLK